MAVGLSMDAFAVSVCKGLAMKKTSIGKCAAVGAWFGGFQMLMPIIGYFLGVGFARSIESIDHWIAFVLLGFIGIKMIISSRGKDETEDGSLSVKSMFVLAVATSIDALAVGVTFAFLQVEIFSSSLVIGIITFALSAAGVKTGNVFGTKYKSRAEFAGGVILVLLGVKILIEHLI